MNGGCEVLVEESVALVHNLIFKAVSCFMSKAKVNQEDQSVFLCSHLDLLSVPIIHGVAVLIPQGLKLRPNRILRVIAPALLFRQVGERRL